MKVFFTKKFFTKIRYSLHQSRLFFLILIFISGAFLYAEEEVTVINITNARQTSYKKAEDTGNDTIVLEGSVELTVTKGETSSEIKADRITYDRKTEMLYADGNVEITTKDSSAGGEVTTANTLLMNTSTLEGVFDGGRVVQTQSDALNLPSGSTLIVFSNIFGKSENNTIAFKNAKLTFCDDEDPHWHIDASRIWLLPGGEFAFFNAFLYVGVIPVLYLPAFYYPKDELIFNPVFGTKKREGYYFQTTTYLYGRKPLDSTTTETSDENESTSAETLKGLYNFMKPSTLKEQQREGLVLHNLDTDFTGDTTNYLKMMTDWYSNLGGMIGIDGNFKPSQTYVTKLSFNTYLGFSNTVFKDSKGNYMPYHPVTREIMYEGSNFLGYKTDYLRYGANFEFTLSKPFNLSLSLPVYSDPYFAYDFKERQETMDWISYLLDNTTIEDMEEPTISEISSLIWQLSSSYSPTLPSIIKPYINSFSLSLKSSVNISTSNSVFKTYNSLMPSDDPEKVDQIWAQYTPSRKFYYPSQVTPVTFNVSLSGSLFQWPLPKYTKDNKNNPEYAISLNKPDELKSDAELKADEDKKEENEDENNSNENSAENSNEENEENKENKDFELILPSLEFTPVINNLASGLTYNLGYTISSNITTQLAYPSSSTVNREFMNKAEDFDWNNIRASMYTIKIPMTLSSQLKYADSFFGLTNSLSYTPLWQKHPTISLDEEKGGYKEKAAKSLILADYNAENKTVTNSNTLSFKPFSYTEHFSDTGFVWNTNIKLLRQKFIGDADNPEWETIKVDLDDEECVTVNTVDLVLGASEVEKKYKQTLTFTHVIPPLLREYNTKLNLDFPYVSTSFSTGYKETTKEENVPEEERWKKNPFQQSLSVSLFDSNFKLTESYNYDLEEKHHDSLKFSANYKSLQLAYVMTYTQGVHLDPEKGWQNNINSDKTPQKEFIPYSVSFSFSPAAKNYYTWFNRITFAPGLNTSIVADLIRKTNSYLIFSPSISFKITDFLNVTFSATSRNSILYWYFNKGMYDEGGPFPGNMFKDLLNSFNFADKSVREGSGFKLKSLKMAITHELHDWKFNMTFKIEPRLITENSVQRYDFSPYITIGIVWNPMESMKTEIVDEYGEWKLNTK